MILGSTGNDEIDFSAAGLAYTVDYSALSDALALRLRGGSGTVEKGSSGTDSLLGLAAINVTAGLTIIGGSGNDSLRSGLRAGQFVRLDGGAGDDELVGGDAFDQLAFSGPAGVTVTVTGYKGGGMRGTATDGFGDTDSFRKMNEIRGSELADTFVGAEKKDRFAGTAGDDSFDGGTGLDVLRFNRIGIDSVAVDLRAGTATVVAEGDSFTQDPDRHRAYPRQRGR